MDPRFTELAAFWGVGGEEVADFAMLLMTRYETPKAALKVVIALLGSMHELSDSAAKNEIQQLVARELERMRAVERGQ